MCSLDVSGLKDPIANKEFSHDEFKDQITYNENRFYQTGLPWKRNCAPLLDNKEQTRARLSYVTKKLIKIDKLQEYHTVMREQIDNGILERVPEKPTGETVHYIPHQPVIREGAKSTKLRIVFDCSAGPNGSTTSLNMCLESDPSLQPKLFDIMLRNRFCPYVIVGDLQKAFLQIRIDQKYRDAERVLWPTIKNRER